jgi:hypothetical protein
MGSIRAIIKLLKFSSLPIMKLTGDVMTRIAADTKAIELRLYQLIMLHLRFHGSTLAFRLILLPTTVLGLQPCAFRSDRNGCLT